MSNLRLYYKSDYKIRETFKTQAGTIIDPRNFNFEFVFIAGKENTFTCSHTIGASTEWVNCVYDSVNNAVLCTLDNHNLLPGRLKRELTIEEPDSDFPDGKLDYVTYKAYEIELVETPDGDSIYDIYDDETIISGNISSAILSQILHNVDVKDNIKDADELNYLDSGNGFGIVKTTWLNIKAKLKAYFDTIYASITHNHNLADLSEKSYNSLDDLPTLDFEPADANIQSHIGDGDIHVTSEEKSTWDAKLDVSTVIPSLDTIDKRLTPAINEVNAIAKGAGNGETITDIEALVILLNAAVPTDYPYGKNFYVVDTEVPDYWISAIGSSSVPYVYVDDTTFLDDLAVTGSLQVGYYSISELEGQKVDLTDYYDKNAADLLLGAKEDITNKSSNVDTDKTSTTKYANVKAIYDWAVAKFIDLTKIVTTWTATTLNTNIPSEKLVKDSLNLKAEITTFENTVVNNWVADTTYVNFGYKADISLSGVISTDIIEIVFGHNEAVSGYYSPICLVDNGKITIYSKVNTSITLPLIIKIK